jgi:tetratricopeptide (TPR) repeat protein
MSYLDYASVVTHPLRFDLLQEPTAVPFGTAAEGGHAINLMSDQRSSVHGLALYVLQARAGAAFKQSDGLLRPTLIRDATPIAFEEKLASEVDIVGGTFYGDPAEYCDRAMGHLQAGALDQALADAERAIARTDKLSTGFTCRGIVLAALGRLEDAVADFNRALELNADDSRSLAHRGATHAQLDDLVSALRDLDRSIGLNPNDGFAFRARARVRRVAGLARLADQDEAEAQRIRSL